MGGGEVVMIRRRWIGGLRWRVVAGLALVEVIRRRGLRRGRPWTDVELELVEVVRRRWLIGWRQGVVEGVKEEVTIGWRRLSGVEGLAEWS